MRGERARKTALLKERETNEIHMLFIIRFPVNVVLLSFLIIRIHIHIHRQEQRTIKCCIFHMNCSSSTRASWNALLLCNPFSHAVPFKSNELSQPLKIRASLCHWNCFAAQNLFTKIRNVDRNIVFIHYSCCCGAARKQLKALATHGFESRRVKNHFILIP